MFAIKSVRITDVNEEILNISLCDNRFAKSFSGNHTTLVLGENGVGKSFLLKSIIDIFLFLENAKTHKRKPKYKYEKFWIEYTINSEDYYVNRVSGSKIVAKRNGEYIDHKDVKLPEKLLAISFMVNDKFPFIKDNEDGMYTYHGVRSSTNSTFTSSITRNITFDLINCIKKKYNDQLIEIFSLLQFDPVVEMENEENGKISRKKIVLDSKEAVSFQSFTKWKYPTMFFRKNGKRISFDMCSSGEKHLLFAYIGILSRIKDGSLIIIDEPEISLHPEWQIRYISTLNKLFSKYHDCCFILASHSHYFVSELKSESSSIIVLRGHSSREKWSPNAEIIPYDTYAWSAENIIYNVFGIRTTRNYYFEGDLNYLLTALQEFDGSPEKLNSIGAQISKLEKYVYSQHDPLHKLLCEAKERIKC